MLSFANNSVFFNDTMENVALSVYDHSFIGAREFFKRMNECFAHVYISGVDAKMYLVRTSAGHYDLLYEHWLDDILGCMCAERYLGSEREGVFQSRRHLHERLDVAHEHDLTRWCIDNIQCSPNGKILTIDPSCCTRRQLARVWRNAELPEQPLFERPNYFPFVNRGGWCYTLNGEALY